MLAPRVTWNALQTIFLADTVADVLLIMDCCNALGAFQPGQSVQSGNVMLWAACDQNAKTPVSGQASFTENLIAVLEEVDEEGGDVDELHGELFYRLSTFQNLNGVRARSIPVCMTISRSRDGRRIRIKKLPASDDILEGAPEWTDQEVMLTPPRFPGGLSNVAIHDVPVNPGARIERHTAGSSFSRASRQTRHHAAVISQRSREDTFQNSGGRPSLAESSGSYQEPHNGSPATAPPEGNTVHDSELPIDHGVAPSEAEALVVVVIHELLWFPENRARESSVIDAYSNTFEWIFQHEIFEKWTTGPMLILWVSGKAGSGKSTFMRYLIDHRLQGSLNVWSNGSPVLFTSFFFWAAGTRLQRSCEGCLRSLLVQIVDQDPASALYAYKIFISAYEDGEDTTRLLAYTHLRHVLGMLVVSPDSPMRKKFWCLFLDGLDECDDWDGVLDIVRCLQKGSHIKLCVSSRPSSLFIVTFDSAPRLRMEDLTYNDILTYVHGRLASAVQGGDTMYGSELENIGALIAHQASGVFLWVVLTTRSIIRGIISGDDAQTLIQRLNMIPADLAGLYARLFAALTPDAARAFLVAQACEVEVLDMQSGATIQPILTTTLLIFALKKNTQDALSAPVRPETSLERSRRADEMAQLLRQSASDIMTVDVRSVQDPLESGNAVTISYLHKTARDFISEFSVTNRLREDSSASGFNAHLALLRGLILDVKVQNIDVLIPFKDFSIDLLSQLPFWTKVEQAIKYAGTVFGQDEESLSDEVVQLLDELDRVVQVQVGIWSKHSLRKHWSSLMPLGATMQLVDHADTFLSFTTSCGLWEYVSHKLKGGVPLQKPGKPLLFYAIQPQPQFAGSSKIVATVDLLFKHGADPDEAFLGESAWRRFLKTFHLHDAYHDQTERTKHLREIYQLFIDHGADETVADAAAAEAGVDVDWTSLKRQRPRSASSRESSH